MSDIVLAHNPEAFYYYGTPITGAGRTWVGSPPYIDTADADTSYGEVDTLVTGYNAGQWIGFQLLPFVAPAGVTGARIDMQMYFSAVGGANDAEGWLLYCDDGAAWFSQNSHPSFSAAPGWNTFVDTTTFVDADGPGFDLVSLLAALATGNLMLMSYTDQANNTFRTSQLSLTLTGGIPPLRQVQRDDGLGRSAVRARGCTSVQKSIRQRGYR